MDEETWERTRETDARLVREARAAGGVLVAWPGGAPTLRVLRDLRDVVEGLGQHEARSFSDLIVDLGHDPVPDASESLADDGYLRRIWVDGDRVLYEVGPSGESVTVYAIVRASEG